ncbi:MAG: hypothetical protein IJ035_00060 [Oscillospiraceae bacterium]|nr:hypothetical protein [Oscillospiraceae bacterium]
MKIKAAVLAFIFCVTLCSCGKSENDEVVLTELIETEAAISDITETAAEMEVTSETQVETSVEAMEATVQTTEITGTEAVTEVAENNSLEIAQINFNYSCPEEDWYYYYDISARNSRVYVIASGGNTDSKTGLITDKQFAKVIEAVNQSGVSAYYGMDNSNDFDSSLPVDVCSVTITDIDGNEFSAVQCGDIPEAFTELDDVLNKYAETAYYGEDVSQYAQIGIRKAVDAMVYFRSYLRKCSDLGEDCSAYAGQSIIIDSSDLNPLDSDMFYLPDDWSGYAFVKFNADGTDVEYANWAETEEALSEEKLIYDDLEAYYIENEIIIGSTLEE